MQKIWVPVGISDFREIIEEDLYFVDKSNFIKALLSVKGEKVTLFTRPRRFGKTLCMHMLAEFFDIRKDSRALFSGLQIAQEKKLCEDWQNQYPTILMTLKNVNGLKFDDAYGMLKDVIAALYKAHAYLLGGDAIDDDSKDIFERIVKKTAAASELKNSLMFLVDQLQSYYHRPVILLIDEYDVPIAKADQNGYYREMIDMIGAMLSAVLKDNPALKKAVITGCLKIAKESIFTGTNNFVSDTIINTRYDEYFGFTDREVRKLLGDCGLEDHFGDIKAWYDGYRFGQSNVYCPWDVMNYVSELSLDGDASPKAYWNNTSGNTIVRNFIDTHKDIIAGKFETLMSGGVIREKISSELTYDLLYSSVQNLWSVMFFTGYLTKASSEAYSSENKEIALKIPNREVMDIFETTVSEWLEANARTWNTKLTLSAVWDKNTDLAAAEITKLLRKTISYHDYGEDFYHAFLAGIFTGAGYAVESNHEHGDGRSDLVVSDIENGRIAVFEVKYSKKKGDLRDDCRKALLQIDTMRYAEEYSDDYDEILCYGIAFFRKQCLIMIKDKGESNAQLAMCNVQ